MTPRRPARLKRQWASFPRAKTGRIIPCCKNCTFPNPMFTPPPTPPPAPVLTVQQQADLDCLNLGLTLQTSRPGKRPTVDLAAIFLNRLKQSDPKQDWEALAAPMPDAFTAEDFMKQVTRCGTRARQAPKG